jgi:hypothetical protein
MKVSITFASSAASPGASIPGTTAAPTASMAPAISAELRIRGSAGGNSRWRCGAIRRSRHPQRRRVAAAGELDGLPGQGLGLTLQQ